MQEFVDAKMLELRRLGIMHESVIRDAIESAYHHGQSHPSEFKYDGRGPFIILHSGTKFHFFDVQPDDIRIEDIAWALGNECRFGAHSPFFSVAEHCVNVSKVMESKSNNQALPALVGLLHDASEAYLRDIPRPLKYSPVFAQYRELELKIQSAVYEKFGLTQAYEEYQDRLAYIDDAMLHTEMRELFGETHPMYEFAVDNLPHPYAIRPTRWPPHIAANFFAQRYAFLVTQKPK